MTATVVSADAPDTEPIDQRRLLSISANLLPREIVAARRGRVFRRVFILLLVVIIACVAGLYLNARNQVSSAQQNLSDAQRDAAAVRSQQAQFTGLGNIQAQLTAISTELQTLMAGDLAWYKLLPALREAAPTGVVITGFNGTSVSAGSSGGAVATSSPAPASGGATSSAGATPSPTTAVAVGTLSITGTAPDPATVAAYADVLGKVAGLGHPFVNSVTTAAGVLTFSVTLEVTTAAAGARFAAPTTTPASR